MKKLFLNSIWMLALVAVCFTACEEEEHSIQLEEEANLYSLSVPMEYIANDTHIDMSNYEASFDISDIVNNNIIIPRDHCPAYENALKKLREYSNSCEFSDDYCEYLRQWWRIHLFIAGMQCYPDAFCQFCPVYSILGDDINAAYAAGLPDSYYSNLLTQYKKLVVGLCNEC